MASENRSFELIEEFDAEVGQLFVIFSDERRWPEGSISRILVSRAPGFVQVAFADMSRASLQLTSLGAGKTKLELKHELLASADAAKAQKKAWQNYLELLRKQVEV